MTEIKLFWHKGLLCGISVCGHSDSIVCAAVSSLVHALMLGLEDVAKVRGLRCTADRETPFIELRWPHSEAFRLDLLTRTTALSLREIRKDNPDCICITEVQS